MVVRTESLRTQSARHRVDQPTISGRSCANSGHYKPLLARKLRKVKPSAENNIANPPWFTWRTFWTRLIDSGQPCPTLGFRLAGNVTGIYQNTAHMRVNA